MTSPFLDTYCKYLLCDFLCFIVTLSFDKQKFSILIEFNVSAVSFMDSTFLCII